MIQRLIRPRFRATLAAQMRGVNDYWRGLTSSEIARNEHREYVGGLWDEVGKLQFEFLRAQGLKPGHKLLDAGCGSLRGGLHFIRYLDVGNYYGFDINESLLQAGRHELRRACLEGRHPHLAATATFDAGRFNTQFDFAVSISLFTHLFANHIIRCLKEVRPVLAPGAALYATYFPAPVPGHLDPIEHVSGVRTNFDSDPFHYSLGEMETMARAAGLTVENLGEWGHPRGQRMLRFCL